MAVKRIWFINAPQNNISAEDRCQLAIGISMFPSRWLPDEHVSDTWVLQTSITSSDAWVQEDFIQLDFFQIGGDNWDIIGNPTTTWKLGNSPSDSWVVPTEATTTYTRQGGAD